MKPAPDVRAQDNGAPVAALRQPNPPPEPAATDERSLLVRCISDPDAACDLLASKSLEDASVTSFTAARIRDHPTAPTADLPADDHELVSFMTAPSAHPQAAMLRRLG